MTVRFPNLMSEGHIGNLKLKNRIALSAMGSMYAEPDGTCSDRLISYYETQARGGAGLLILETSTVNSPAGASTPNQLGFGDEKFLPGLTELTQRVHQHGACIAAQLNHSGKVAQEDVAAGRPVLVPSIPKPLKGDLMRALTRAEMATFVSAAGPDGKGPRYHPLTHNDINEVVQQFARAAAQAKAAGMDAVELHGGHGYLIASFLSPYFNTRDDEYGGSPENRCRFLLDIVAAVREAIGPDMPILVRIDACEYRIDGGITIDDALVTAELLSDAGVDAIDVSAYGNGLSGIAFTEAPLVHQPGGLLPFARRIQDVVNIPVMAVGRIEPDVAEHEISAGNIDFVAMGRKLLADPALPNKLAAGTPEAVRPCIYCYVCVSRIFLTSPIVCAVNPAIGRDAELNVPSQPVQRPADQVKHVVIVGGGPAGMEAARVLSLNGHRVTLLEREARLGGTARIAALPYEPNERLVHWLTREVAQLPVDVRLKTTATADSLAALNPDHVLVATGASRKAPAIPGADLPHVFDGESLRSLLLGGDGPKPTGIPWWQRGLVAGARISGALQRISLVRKASRQWMPLGRRIVMIGGGLVGLELAEFLHERGREVTVLEPGAALGVELSVVRRARILHELRESGVGLHRGVDNLRIQSEGVQFTVKGEVKQTVCDHVIISMGAAPNPGLAQRIKSSGLPVTTIGDCQEVGYIEGAMLSARKAAVGLFEAA